MKVNKVEEIRLSDKKWSITKIYVYFIFGIYPLIFHNYYYDIVTSKYIVFLIATGLLIIGSLFLIPDRLFTKIKSGEIKLESTDYFVIGFIFVNIISSVFSENRIDTLNGADGRNVGIVTVVLLGFVYFIVSETFVCDSVFYKVVAVSSTIISILGILNSFDIDFIGFYDGLSYSQRVNYLSTIGHIDVYTNYFAISIPILFLVYLKSGNIKNEIMYFCALVINMVAAGAGHCDSSYIIIVAGIATGIIFSEKAGLKKSVLPVYIWFVTGYFLVKINEGIRQPRKITVIGKILYSNTSFLIITILFCVVIFMDSIRNVDLYEYKNQLAVLIIVIPLLYLAAVFVFTFILKDTYIGSFDKILRIKDSTGSYRGYIWRIVLTEYGKFDFFHKAFGVGTDALLTFLKNAYGEDMYMVTNAYYDNAHNEFLQYLVTTGGLGLISYVGIVICSVKNVLRRKRNMMLAAVVITYVLQSFVNINQVITTPMFFIILAMCNQKKAHG